MSIPYNTMMADVVSSDTESRKRGRPREFDIDAALDKAVRVFRERGYHATSITDLLNAMELASGSVYKAFKDKQAIFVAAFDREEAVRGEKLQRIISTVKSGRDRIREVLIFYAKSSYGAEGKLDGCVAQRVTAALHKSETLIINLIRQGRSDGSISASVDSKITARLLLCLLQGMRVIGKTGRECAEMTAVVDAAMKFLG